MKLSDLIVRKRDDNSLDRDASAAAFLAHLDQLEVQQSARLKLIGEAVEAVFTEHSGKALTKQELASHVFTKLGGDSEGYNALALTVDKYTTPANGYGIQKGRNGGVRRLSDGGFPEPKAGKAASAAAPAAPAAEDESDDSSSDE